MLQEISKTSSTKGLSACHVTHVGLPTGSLFRNVPEHGALPKRQSLGWHSLAQRSDVWGHINEVVGGGYRCRGRCLEGRKKGDPYPGPGPPAALWGLRLLLPRLPLASFTSFQHKHFKYMPKERQTNPHVTIATIAILRPEQSSAQSGLLPTTLLHIVIEIRSSLTIVTSHFSGSFLPSITV